METLRQTAIRMNSKLTLIAIALLLTGCYFNVKPIYNDREQAKAEGAVTQFHKLYNDGRFDEIYTRLDKQVTQSKEEFMNASKVNFDQWGKLQTTRLEQAKVFHSNPIQVKMLYNSTFEKGNAQEWITWNVYDNDVRLFEYRITASWDK